MGAFVGTAKRAGGGRDGAPRRWARCRAGPRLGRLGRGPGGGGSGAGGGLRGRGRRWGWGAERALGEGLGAGVQAGVRGLKEGRGPGAEV